MLLLPSSADFFAEVINSRTRDDDSMGSMRISIEASGVFSEGLGGGRGPGGSNWGIHYLYHLRGFGMFESSKVLGRMESLMKRRRWSRYDLCILDPDVEATPITIVSGARDDEAHAIISLVDSAHGPHVVSIMRMHS